MELERPERSHTHQPDLYYQTTVPNPLAQPGRAGDIANPKRAAVRQRLPVWTTLSEIGPVSPLPCSLAYFEQEAGRKQKAGLTIQAAPR